MFGNGYGCCRCHEKKMYRMHHRMHCGCRKHHECKCMPVEICTMAKPMHCMPMEHHHHMECMEEAEE